MSEEMKQLLAAIGHMAVDQGLPVLEKELMSKVPGPANAILSEIFVLALPKIEAILDADIKEKLGY